MTRIRFNIPAALAKWRTREPATLRRFRMMDLQALHEKTLGPGWFDSSWDLDQGLLVEVALPGDPPFQAWIEAQARPLATVDCHSAPPPSTEGMVEFERVDWRSWVQVGVVADPLPASSAAGVNMPELMLDLAALEPEPELELALV